MPIKLEFDENISIPRKASEWTQNILNCLPREHTRGIERVRFVDTISDSRVKIQQRSGLPGLYHPKQGAQSAWLEVSAGVLLPKSKPFLKRILPRMSFQGNLAAVIFSLIGQHYYLTLRHSIKRTQIESAVRAYTEKYLKVWHERQHSFRSKLFKPLQPTLEKWGRALQKKAAAERKTRANRS